MTLATVSGSSVDLVTHIEHAARAYDDTYRQFSVRPTLVALWEQKKMIKESCTALFKNGGTLSSLIGKIHERRSINPDLISWLEHKMDRVFKKKYNPTASEGVDRLYEIAAVAGLSLLDKREAALQVDPSYEVFYAQLKASKHGLQMAINHDTKESHCPIAPVRDAVVARLEGTVSDKTLEKVKNLFSKPEKSCVCKKVEKGQTKDTLPRHSGERQVMDLEDADRALHQNAKRT